MANISVSTKALGCSSHLFNAASSNFNKILEITAKAIYYDKAIGYLENYPNSAPCIKLKALCYNDLAGIAEHKSDSDRAIVCYIKAIEANNQLSDVYEKLGKLFYNKGLYAKAIETYSKLS